MKLRVQLLAFVGLFGGALVVRAQTVTWSPNPTSVAFELNTNWVGSVSPTTGSALVFGQSLGSSITLNASINVASLTFDGAGSSLSYNFHGSNSAILGIGSGGITLPSTSTGNVELFSDLGVNLTANQTWNTGGVNWSMKVGGPVTGAFRLTKTGAGILQLAGTNTYSGGTTINNGEIQLLANGALGTGPVTMLQTGGAMWTGLDIGATTQTIAGLTIGGSGAVSNAETSIWMYQGGRLTLAGDVTYDAFNAPGTAYISGGALGLSGNRKFQIGKSPSAYSELFIDSPIEGVGASLTKAGPGALELSGTNTYSGGTTVNGGTLRLSASNALPAAGNITVNANAGYPATLEAGIGAQSIGSLTFGGADASAFGQNRITMYTGSSLILGGNVSYLATNGPAGAVIEGGTLALGSTSRTFDVADSANAPEDLIVRSTIDGAWAVGKSGAGTMVLTGQNTFTGGVNHGAGTLLIGSGTLKDGTGAIISGPVGRGTLTLQAGTIFGATQSFGGSQPGELELANRVMFSSVTFGSSATQPGQDLRFSGSAVLGDAAPVVQLAPRQKVFFTGSLGSEGTGTITFQSPSGSGGGLALLAGTTGSLITKVTADHAAVVIGNPAAAPSTLTLAASNGGYIGVAATGLSAPPSPAAVLGRITDKAGFSGTFGLDTDEDAVGAAYVFSDNLDLSGFGANFTLGSLSSAVLTGTITPPVGGYAFGNGGGVLAVRSPLADVGGSKPVSVNSATGDPLLVILQGANTFTGNLSVANSGVILDSAGALPAGATIALGANGYIGYTEAFTGVPNLAALGQRVSAATSTSVLGLDSTTYLSSGLTSSMTSGVRIVTQAVDLSGRASIYLGSATHAIVLGTVLAPNQSGANRMLSLIGVSEGVLEMRSPLVAGNVNSVVVGSTTGGRNGTVLLGGQNTYAGGTTLNAGKLLLGDSSRVSGTTIISGPLGTGALTIPALAQAPVLASSYMGTYVDNAILLGGALLVGVDQGSQLITESMTSSTGYDYDLLTLRGVISDLGTTQVGSLHVRGPTMITSANTFSGGTFLEQGSLVLGHNSALGTGDLTINPAATGTGSSFVALSTGDGPRTISNRLVLNPTDNGYLSIMGNGSLALTGAVVLNGNVRLGPEQYPLYLNGPISGPAALMSSGSSPVFVNGTSNTYGGGTISDWGAIVFNAGGSIPATNLLTANYSGYIGIASPTFATSLQANFLDKFNKASTNGTIGFDTMATTGAANTFAGAIDLQGFGSSARLGSATRAILTGAITPQDTMFNFGGGGGTLDVNTVLTDAAATSRTVWVGSNDYAPLTLRLGGANTYTGGTRVDNSAVIFRSGALPATGPLTAGSGGYIGTEDTSLAPANFISRFQNFTQDAIIGFDSSSGTPYAVSGAVSLVRFDSTTDPRIFLGTATSANISGAITLPAAQNVYRFAGYKGGQLTVSSLLDGTRAVEIADLTNAATFRSPTDLTVPLSSVTLAGTNTYSGGTRLNGGALGIGSSSALGLATSTLTVSGDTYLFGFPSRPLLFASGAARTVPNPISLETDFEVGGTNALTLTGPLTEPASVFSRLYKTGSSLLTLTGANTFSGGVSIMDGSVSFGSLNAAGTGMLEVGGTAATFASFTENAVVNGISSDNGLASISVAAGKTLTVNQASSATYAGQFALGTGASLLFGGPDPAHNSVLRLAGSSTFAGNTSILSGIIVLATVNNALGAATNQVQLNGGTLAVDPGVTFANPITLNSGGLSGMGTFTTGTTFHIKNQVQVAPGNLHGPGMLAFNGSGSLIGPVLSLESGGTYFWQIADATNATGGISRISVAGAVDIPATAAMPFTFRIMPAGAGDLMTTSVLNFNPTQSYSWTVLSATSITGFDPTKFQFNTTSMAGLMGVGSFFVSLDGTSTNLLLNFTPVPEPSTWMMLSAGAIAVVIGCRRRRRS